METHSPVLPDALAQNTRTAHLSMRLGRVTSTGRTGVGISVGRGGVLQSDLRNSLSRLYFVGGTCLSGEAGAYPWSNNSAVIFEKILVYADVKWFGLGKIAAGYIDANQPNA